MAPEPRHGPPEPAAVRALAAAATEADGIAPYGEQTLLNLDASGAAADVLHARLVTGAGLVGYAQLDRGSAELAVHPAARRAGHGTRLLEAMLAAGEGDLAIWAHGNLPGARALAARYELAARRELLYLTADLGAGDPASDPAAALADRGLTSTTFTPGGRDEADWVALNAAAFADHPEQGRLTLADLHARMAQPWFDPRLFWLARAREGGDLLGAMWVKPDEAGRSAEIYVLGVHPSAQGRRLGGLLTDLAMAEARRRGYERMDLYVEGDNRPALATYARHGFTTAQTHVQYSRAPA